MTGKLEYLGGWIPDTSRSTVTAHLSIGDVSRLHMEPEALDYFDTYRKNISVIRSSMARGQNIFWKRS